MIYLLQEVLAFGSSTVDFEVRTRLRGGRCSSLWLHGLEDLAGLIVRPSTGLRSW